LPPPFSADSTSSSSFSSSPPCARSWPSRPASAATRSEPSSGRSRATSTASTRAVRLAHERERACSFSRPSSLPPPLPGIERRASSVGRGGGGNATRKARPRRRHSSLSTARGALLEPRLAPRDEMRRFRGPLPSERDPHLALFFPLSSRARIAFVSSFSCPLTLPPSLFTPSPPPKLAQLHRLLRRRLRPPARACECVRLEGGEREREREGETFFSLLLFGRRFSFFHAHLFRPSQLSLQKKTKRKNHPTKHHDSYFNEATGGRYVPRAVLMDLGENNLRREEQGREGERAREGKRERASDEKLAAWLLFFLFERELLRRRPAPTTA